MIYAEFTILDLQSEVFCSIIPKLFFFNKKQKSKKEIYFGIYFKFGNKA